MYMYYSCMNFIKFYLYRLVLIRLGGRYILFGLCTSSVNNGLFFCFFASFLYSNVIKAQILQTLLFDLKHFTPSK